MPEQREFIDGTFYWVRRGEDRLVLQCVILADGAVQWDCPGLLPFYVDVDEIGPLIGKEPPGAEREATVAFLWRKASCYSDWSTSSAIECLADRIEKGEHI